MPGATAPDEPAKLKYPHALMPTDIYIPPPGQTRRGFLRKGLLGGLALALFGGGFLALRRGRLLPPPPEGLLTFDEREYAVLHAIASRFVVPTAGFPSAEEARTAIRADRALARADESVRQDVKRLLMLFENGLVNFLFGRRPRPFTELSPEEQDAVLREWRDSRIELRRSAFQALRVLVLTSHYSSPLTWPALGYPGPPEGFHQPEAPVWKGGGTPRPPGNGVYVELPEPEEAGP